MAVFISLTIGLALMSLFIVTLGHSYDEAVERGKPQLIRFRARMILNRKAVRLGLKYLLGRAKCCLCLEKHNSLSMQDRSFSCQRTLQDMPLSHSGGSPKGLFNTKAALDGYCDYTKNAYIWYS